MTTPQAPNADPAGIREMVKSAYGAIPGRKAADEASGCCGPTCCGGTDERAPAKAIGYADADLDEALDDANLGLGCGNPNAIAGLAPGEVVLDLGAGGGLDALIAARRVGPTGRVIGVDMTPQMLALARENAVKAGVHDRVEFREGIIEALPVVSDSVDVIISNCVVNLSPDKPAVFREAYRVLKPGGRLALSDILLTAPLNPAVAQDAAAYLGCIGGAALEREYLGALEAAGFVDITWERRPATAVLTAGIEAPGARELVARLGRDLILAEAAKVWSYDVRARKL